MSKATFTNAFTSWFLRGWHVNKEEQGEPVSVSLEPGCPVWSGYDIGVRWNGFTCPAFDRQTCDAIAEQWEHDNDEIVRFVDDNDGGRYEVFQNMEDYTSNNPIEIFDFCGYSPDGSKLYALGAGSWIWSKVD